MLGIKITMGSYGDYGYGFENNYGYGKSDFGRGAGRNNWQQGNSGNRKRRSNYDQMQQFEQRRGRHWRNNQGGWGDNDEWYGNESYDDGYYGGWQEEEYGYNDGYGNSRKRGRFYGDDARDGQYMERGPHSVNFYDDYDDSYHRKPSRRGRSWHGDSRRGHHGGRYYEEESEWSGRFDRRGDSSYSYYSKRDFTRKPVKPIRKKSDAEDAVYEKHKKVTVERGKRERISNTVHSIITVFREVALELSQQKYKKENGKINEEEQKNLSPEATQSEEKTDNSENNSETTDAEMKTECTDVSSTDNTQSEQNNDSENVESETKMECTEISSEDNVQSENTTSTEESKDDDAVATSVQTNNDSKTEKKDQSDEKSNVEKPSKSHHEPVILSAIKCGESAMRILVGDSLQATVVVVTKVNLCKFKKQFILVFRNKSFNY